MTRISVLYRETEKPVLSRKNWILESDILLKSPDSTKQYSTIGYKDTKKPYRILGKMREYDGEMTSEGEHLPHLSAVSTGKPYFSGYYPECKNVLGCYDKFSDIEVGTGDKEFARLTYIVSGWVENENPADCTVCHGIVTDIKWKGSDCRYESGIPGGMNAPQVALGNSLEEAAAALCACGVERPEQNKMEKVFEHLFFGTLSEWEKLDGALEGEKKVKQYQFSPEQSWEEIKIQGKDNRCLKKRQELLEQIAGSREKQQEYEEQINEKRREIYLLWRKYAMDNTFLGDAEKGITGRIEEISRIEERRKKEYAREQKLTKKLNEELKEEESLIETAGGSYWKPRDLTFLLCGAEQSNIYRRLESFKTDGKTPERTREQLIREIRVKISEVTPGEGIWVAGHEFLCGTNQFQERLLEELVEEGMLTARGCIFYLAHSLICRYEKKESPELLSDAVMGIERCIQEKNNLNGGQLSSPIGNYIFQPSWNPLILEWKMKYYPDSKLREDWGNLEDWSLGETDYQYTGSGIDKKFFEVVSGRSVLSPYGSAYLSERFGTYAGDDKFKDMRNKIAEMKILSQTLDGFHDHLLTRRENMVIAPWMNPALDSQITPIASLAAEDIELYEDRNQSLSNPKSPMEAFYPVRAGAARIDAVRVIDSFGRVLEYDVRDVILPESLRMGKANIASEILLRPRILAPMRIQSRWLMEETGTGDEVSPVYGWIWVNLLDSCLHIYHPDGSMAGSIQNVLKMDGSGEYETILRNPPGQTKKTKEILDTMGVKLRRFIKGILRACKKEPETLYEFLKSLDESMWTSRSGGNTVQDEILAYLGRPLALAGIEVKLDMKGSCPMPMFYNDGDRQESPLKKLLIPLRIGDEVCQTDGTVGFYRQRRGERFRVFHRCGKKEGKVSYIDGETTLKIRAAGEDAPIKLTVLFHPAGKISMTTGLLPVKEMKLSEAWTERALKNIYLALYYGPFLTPRSQTQMFLPKAMEKEWSFLSFEKPGVQREEYDMTPPRMETEQEEEWKQIKEGWILLRARTEKKR